MLIEAIVIPNPGKEYPDMVELFHCDRCMVAGPIAATANAALAAALARGWAVKLNQEFTVKWLDSERIQRHASELFCPACHSEMEV
jgi:hypothetical protein